MLDYSSTTVLKHGAALLHSSAARHVPNSSGVYQIIPTPYTFQKGKEDAAIRNYMSAINRNILDTKLGISTELSVNGRNLSIGLWQASENEEFNGLPANVTELFKRICTFFPPIYVGQAKSLRDRFVQHAQGRSSHIQESLSEAMLEKNFVVFRWVELPEDGLDAIEGILIKSIKPDFNTNLR